MDDSLVYYSQHPGHLVAMIVLMNNSLHDIATALLGASGIAIRVLVRRFEAGTGGGSNPEARAYFAGIYEGVKRLARYSLYLIFLGGIPRTIFYRGYEWEIAVEHNQVAALIAKHALIIAFVTYGALTWQKYGQRARQIAAPDSLQSTPQA